MIEPDRKVNDVFAGKVVRKDLVRKVKVGVNVPVHVLEYLIGKYFSTCLLVCSLILSHDHGTANLFQRFQQTADAHYSPNYW